MSVTVDAVDTVTIRPLLSSDIIIEIFNVAYWRTILSMRQVSTLWYELSKTWSIWATVVLRETLPKFNRPTLCYLEKPLEKYTSHELEALLKRWKLAKNALQGGFCGPPQIKSFAMPALPRGLIRRLLLPGGRWLITLHGAGASYFDLEAEAPEAHTLFPSQYLDPSAAPFKVDNPCLQHDFDLDGWSNGLKVLMAFTFFDVRISTWIAQVWEIKSAEDDRLSKLRLHATLRTSMKFRIDGNLGSVLCRSVTADRLALSIMDGHNMSQECISLVEWPNLDLDAGLDFIRVTTIPNRDRTQGSELILVPRQPRLLVLTNSAVFLDDYFLVPHREGHPTLAEAQADEANCRRRLLLSNSNSITQTYSRPYVFFCNPGIRASPIKIRIVARNHYHGRAMGVEAQIPFADSEDSEAGFSARYAHLGALPTIGLSANVLLRHGHATATYRTARNVRPGINTYIWESHWEAGKHNSKPLKALEALSGWDKFHYGELVDMDEGTARYVSYTDHPAPMLHVMDFTARNEHKDAI